MRVSPRASRAGLDRVMEGRLWVRLNSPPVEGRANEECRKLLARALKLSKRQVELVSGVKSREKTFLLRDVTLADVEARLRTALGQK